MALDLYGQTNIERGLLSSLIMALATYAANDGRNTEHVVGVLDHAHAQAVLYGLSWPAIVHECKAGLNAGARELLDVVLLSASLEGDV